MLSINRVMRTFFQSPDGCLHMGIPISTDMDIKQRFNIACTLPKGAGGAAVEAMIAYGTVIGRGSTFRFTGDLAGKTLIVTDSRATNPGTKTITFVRSGFADPQQPTLAEIVAACNAVFAADAAPTVASAGVNGNLVITGAAASATAVLTIGPGTANMLLGFPEDGCTMKIDNAAGVSLILPSTWDQQVLKTRCPIVRPTTLTPATLVKAKADDVAWSFTPSTRTLLLTDASAAGVQRAMWTSAEV